MNPAQPEVVFQSDPPPRLPPRSASSHKGDYGRVLLIGGSKGMAGAIGLAGMAALRSGAGLVKLAVPDAVTSVVAAYEPSYMTANLPCDDSGCFSQAARQPLLELASGATAVACGPGLGRSGELTAIVGELFTTLKQPAVFDADALNALSTQPDWLCQPGGPRVLTPHPAEFARLLGIPLAQALAERNQLAAAAALRWGVVLLVKGSGTLITDGRRSALNTTGNPGMATGGTGDVLTGIIAALLGQGLAPFEAARLGAYLHGLAGDLAADELGQTSLTASDLCRYLPRAFKSYV
ncbi:MAG: NAD(P)H-hydrate dehydratase [Pirellulales bacterium]